MARMIDPSTLTGEELFNWYTRSPADVEAEREAARQAQYDAFVKSIQQPSPDGGESFGSTPSNQAGESSSREPRLVEAKYLEPPLPTVMGPPVMETPSGFRVGPTVSAPGGAPSSPPRSGFFGSNTYSDTLGGYHTDLPSPLNFVFSMPGKWWQLNDHSVASTDEVERIYAEQQRRLRGQDKSVPAARVHVVDNLPAGQIPTAKQLQKDDRELDPTCHPNGGWERDANFEKYSDAAKRYEIQIARAPGLDYVVRNPGQSPVRFDGCAVWDRRHPLLEAKGPNYAPLIDRARNSTFYPLMRAKDIGQPERQARAARNQRIEWHVAEPAAFDYFNGLTGDHQPPIVVQVTPPR